MTYYSDDWLTILEGDCREVLASMEPESVHCVVTSPPYWGLRDYGTATWVGGDELHQHEGAQMRTAPPGTDKQASNFGALSVRSGDCKCGAIRQDSQLGLEPTPEAYVESMVAVFREVRRVLRADGTVWLNLGDSYATGQSSDNRSSEERARSSTLGPKRDGLGGENAAHKAVSFEPRPRLAGLAQKQLVGIPWRVAFALQADGWYLRSDIIWSKPNPMPESVTDRPTKAHEYLFLLSKSPRYYYDADAVREPQRTDEATFYAKLIKQPHKGQRGKDEVNDRRTTGGFQDATYNPAGRNLRSVWTVATQPYPGAHFATFPEKLVEPCILAGTSAKGVCPECGAPWVREVERETGDAPLRSHGTHPGSKHLQGPASRLNSGTAEQYHANRDRTVTTGWRPSCDHAPFRPCAATVLDPFAGSGTTARVAARLSRRAVLIDLNADYLGQAMKRNHDIPLGLESA